MLSVYAGESLAVREPRFFESTILLGMLDPREPIDRTSEDFDFVKCYSDEKELDRICKSVVQLGVPYSGPQSSD